MEAAELVGLLAEPERLRVVAALVLGARTPTDIVEATGLEPKEVAAALRRLHAGGLVVEADGGNEVRAELFSDAVRAAAPPDEVGESFGYADPKVERLVRTFVRNGRLVSLPAQRGRRRTVLEHVVCSFEPGVRYSEYEVDTVLHAWSAGCPVDHVALRRYLVDENLLDREGGEYWRCGGRLDQ
jgi:hypothetical protein